MQLVERKCYTITPCIPIYLFMDEKNLNSCLNLLLVTDRNKIYFILSYQQKVTLKHAKWAEWEDSSITPIKRCMSNKNLVFKLNNYLLKFAIYLGSLDKSCTNHSEYTELNSKEI